VPGARISWGLIFAEWWWAFVLLTSWVDLDLVLGWMDLDVWSCCLRVSFIGLFLLYEGGVSLDEAR